MHASFAGVAAWALMETAWRALHCSGTSVHACHLSKLISHKTCAQAKSFLLMVYRCTVAQSYFRAFRDTAIALFSFSEAEERIAMAVSLKALLPRVLLICGKLCS